MSLITAVFVPTGVVLSGDSRTTGTSRQQAPDPLNPQAQITVQTNILLSDATDKVFLLDDRYGVGTYGAAMIGTLPIAHYMAQHQAQPNRQPVASVMALANDLLAYFRTLEPIPKTWLLVVGYDGPDPWVVGVDIEANTAERYNLDMATNKVTYGARWGGDSAIVSRLLSNTTFAFDVMNIQDAVDFSRHLIRSTIDQLRFEPRFPTVGGPIDTLVITTTEARFLQKKDLKTA
jgi:hypothetical protein